MAKQRQKVIRTRLGEREISLDSVICFPKGLIGVEERREFVLLPLGEETPFMLLQSTNDPNFGLLVTDPYTFMDAFEVRLDMAVKKTLRLENIKQAALLVTVTIPSSDPENLTLNLSGPIVINTKARIGMQIPQVDPTQPSHFRPVKDGKPQTP